MRSSASSSEAIQPFAPDAPLRKTLDRAVRTAFGMSRAIDFGVAVNTVGLGAKYPFAFTDAQGKFLTWGEVLSAAPAQGHSGEVVLVGNGLRRTHRLRAR